MKSGKTFLTSFFFGVLILNLVFGVFAYNKKSSQEINEEDGIDSIRLYVDVIRRLKKSYVDKDKVVYKKLVYNSLRGLLKSLDKHSSFMDAEQFTQMQEETVGQFAGLGIVVNKKNGIMNILSPIPGGPAEKAGILANDQIIKINNEILKGHSLRENIKKMKGEPGTDVDLNIYRPSIKKELDIKVTREIIKVKSVVGVKIFPQNIGYLRITQFNTPTSTEFHDTLTKLIEEKQCKALVIDLRFNPGGLLKSATEICNNFIQSGKLIVSIEGRKGTHSKKINANFAEKFNIPIIILINGSSASASEITAGCLQDYNLAILVGTKSYGKGSVQTIVPMRGNTAIRFTTAKYFTPNKRIIHGKGITPDVIIEISPKERKKLYQHLSYLEYNKKSDYNDIQLNNSLSLIKKILNKIQKENIRDYLKQHPKLIKEYTVNKIKS